MLDFGTSLYIEYLVATGYLPPQDLEGSPTLIISPSTPAKNDFNIPIFLFLDSWQADVTMASSIRRAARSLVGYSTRPGHGNIDSSVFSFSFFSSFPIDLLIRSLDLPLASFPVLELTKVEFRGEAESEAAGRFGPYYPSLGAYGPSLTLRISKEKMSIYPISTHGSY